MSKSPGFWFFVGDWMKDPELRFCSLFARGLLVDLLCLMFESKEQGYLSKPNGEPRSDLDIVNAISGGTCDEKIEALRELEQNGVLSRDSRGVLFSRRIARIGELSQTRSKAGSKRVSKTEAKREQNTKQNDIQNTGVSVSVSDSVSSPPKSPKGPSGGDDVEIPPKLKTVRFKKLFQDWLSVVALESTAGKPPNVISQQATIGRLADFSERKACGYLTAWIDKRRVFPDWKTDFEPYMPPDEVPKSAEPETYEPRKKPMNRKETIANG